MKLKVCGMKYQDNIEAVVALKPDLLGFIFYERSSRYIPKDHHLKIPNSILKVGVFVDAELKEIKQRINNYALEFIQLHGHESPEFCSRVQQLGVKVIKVFSILNTFDFNQLEAFEPDCDYFLFDTKGELPGGNGIAFDWKILESYPSNKPFFLSGGIGLDQIDNLHSFLKSEAAAHCYAIDVNSKFELEPGLKNINELKVFKSQL
ncbi:MAG: phosphoribosylanthranilate isomerase [Bacteroidia bacterium]|nr:phosphoribosylanthranilate isomerase [Bacteroidia bacterium]MBT8278312.1 phosphoribosylanthranilate isomerase [Bacteroidia bacterium]NNK60059.1 phosphoribosylanthranilate isomerase [Flavobacteriaceae bacterium]NNL34127.1 phosphoribosylanthranilate isomerase [Flavobacteriaceae bacterium]